MPAQAEKREQTRVHATAALHGRLGRGGATAEGRDEQPRSGTLRGASERTWSHRARLSRRGRPRRGHGRTGHGFLHANGRTCIRQRTTAHGRSASARRYGPRWRSHARCGHLGSATHSTAASVPAYLSATGRRQRSEDESENSKENELVQTEAVPGPAKPHALHGALPLPPFS